MVRSYRLRLRRLEKESSSSFQIVSFGYRMRTRLAAANSSRRNWVAAPAPLLALQWSASEVKVMQTFPSSEKIGLPPCCLPVNPNCPRGARQGTLVAAAKRSGYTKAILNWSTSTLLSPLHWRQTRITGWRFSALILLLYCMRVSADHTIAPSTKTEQLLQRVMRNVTRGLKGSDPPGLP